MTALLLAAGVAAAVVVALLAVGRLIDWLVDRFGEAARHALVWLLVWLFVTFIVWVLLPRPSRAATLSFTVPRYAGGVGTLAALPDSSTPCAHIEAVIAYRFGQQSATWLQYGVACLTDPARWAAVRADAAPVQVASKGVTWWKDAGTRVLLPLPVTVDTLCYFAVGRSRWPDGRVAEGLPGNVVEVKP